MALGYNEVGEKKEAVKEFLKALEIDGENLDARWELANTYIDLEMFDRAVVELKEILKRDPMNFDVAGTLEYLKSSGKVSEHKTSKTAPKTSKGKGKSTKKD